MNATSELDRAIAEAELILIAIPSQSLSDVARNLGEVVQPEQMVIHGTKGLESEATTACQKSYKKTKILR